MIIPKTSFEGKRGCGYRRGGGIYLVSAGVSAPCGKLPLLLEVCPTCNHGIKPSLGWTWFDVSQFVKSDYCKNQYSEVKPQVFELNCDTCPLGLNPVERSGLIWIGERFYKTPEIWLREANKMGVSRKIKAVPRDFVLGETWVFVAHRKAIQETCSNCIAGLRISDDGRLSKKDKCPECEKGIISQKAIFHAFKPTAIEYVIKGDETQEELEALVKRGLTPIKVEKLENEKLELESDGSSDLDNRLSENFGVEEGVLFE